MKKTIINAILILTILIVYYLQANFFNWFTISGIMPNLFIILVLFIGLFSNKIMGIVYGLIIGVILDLLLSAKFGIYTIGLGTIAILAGVYEKNFSKDSRITIMVMVVTSTIIFEIIAYILNYVLVGINIEILNFVKILLVEGIYNLILTIIIYPLFQKAGYYIENEYKGNKILTRYF